MSDASMNLSCPCGQVQLRLSERPAFIHECNCSLCAGTGARWGYFHPDQVHVAGETASWSRDDKPEPAAEVRSCPGCGATTHFTLTPEAVAKHGNTMLGVNMRLADEPALAGIELRYPDGAAWDGKSPFGYVREARVIGTD